MADHDCLALFRAVSRFFALFHVVCGSLWLLAAADGYLPFSDARLAAFEAAAAAACGGGRVCARMAVDVNLGLGENS
eukprot:1790356-Pleurochrysis_carterae.AAC.1